MFVLYDIKDNLYKNLMDMPFDVCDEFVLVVRKDLDFNDNGKAILEKLDVSLKYMKEQWEWAGTQCFGEFPAEVYYYKTDNHAREIIKEVAIRSGVFSN